MAVARIEENLLFGLFYAATNRWKDTESCNNLGVLYTYTNRPDDAERVYVKALEIKERLVRDNPAVSGHQLNLAGSCPIFTRRRRAKPRP